MVVQVVQNDAGKAKAAFVQRFGVQQHVVQRAEYIPGDEQDRELQRFRKVRVEAVFR